MRLQVGPSGGTSVLRREAEFLIRGTSALAPKGSAWQRSPAPEASRWARSRRLRTRVTSEKPLTATPGLACDRTAEHWNLPSGHMTLSQPGFLHPAPESERRGGRRSSGASLPLSGTCSAEPSLPALSKRADFAQGHPQGRFNPFPGI